MAFYYNQGNLAERVEEQGERSIIANHDRASHDQRAQQHHYPADTVDPEQTHIRATNATNAAGGSGKRRERIGETLRIARQGVTRREANRLARLFGEPGAETSDHSRHGRRRDRQALTVDIESSLETREVLLNSEGRVSYGTWRGLIMYLTSTRQRTDDFTITFMLTFRSFATPKDLAEALVARAREVAALTSKCPRSETKAWQERVQAPIQYNVFRIIQLWYNSYWLPCMDDPLLNYLCAFLLNEYLPSRRGSSEKECQKLLHKITSKNSSLDLHALAASPGTGLVPMDMHRSNMSKSFGVDDLESNNSTSNSTDMNTSPKFALRHVYAEDAGASNSAFDKSVFKRERKHRRGESNRSSWNEKSKDMAADMASMPDTDDSNYLSTESAKQLLSENRTAQNSQRNNRRDNNNNRSGGYSENSSQTHGFKPKNFLRRLFTRQNNNTSNNDSTPASYPPSNNSDNSSLLGAFTSTRDGSISPAVYFEKQSRPPTIDRSEGQITAHRLSPARIRILEEINNNPDENENRRHVARSNSRSSEDPDISDLLMATVGMDLSYEAYRQMSHITHVSPIDVACQLTIIESSCFCMIQPKELLNKEFSRGSRSCAVNVRQMTKWCTQITRWASALILLEPTPERRCRMLKYFIQLGMQLLALKNYDAVMAIKAAIFCAAVMRLKLSWSMLPKKFNIMSKRLHEAMDSDHNFANYRSVLRRSQPPLLPFLGLYLTDLTFLDDGNPTYRRFVESDEGITTKYCDDHQPHTGLVSPNSENDYHSVAGRPSDNCNNPVYPFNSQEDDDEGGNDTRQTPSINQQLDSESGGPQNSDCVASSNKNSSNGTQSAANPLRRKEANSSTVHLIGQSCALFANRKDVDLNSRSILINFEKSYKIAGIIQEIQKFQVEYSGNFTMAIPGLQRYLIEQWDRCEAEGYDDDKIYSMSLQCEPRAACPSEFTDSNRASHHQSMQTAMRFTRLLPGGQRSRNKDVSYSTTSMYEKSIKAE
ncbi:ras guanine nucleotide exchange factor domain-containing protein [Coemansia spiralis]|nr:ras guanine nucleotide exchange factor domain-containing protein [Coemansia spiralis]